MNKLHYIPVAVACTAGFAGIELARAQTVRTQSKPATTAKKAPPRIPTATAATTAPKAPPTIPEAPCTEYPDGRCYDVRHDFVISVPVRPELAGARANVTTLENSLKPLQDRLTSLQQKVASTEALLADATRREADLRGKAGFEKQYAEAKTQMDTFTAQLAKLKIDVDSVSAAVTQATQQLNQARQTVTDLSKPADISLSASTFVLASTLPLNQVAEANPAYHYTTAYTSNPLYRGCETQNSFYVAKANNVLKVLPEQPWVLCYSLRVLSGETVADGSSSNPRSLPSVTFELTRVGTFKHAVDIDSPPGYSAFKTSRAWSDITITSFTRTPDGALTVTGSVQSSGRTPGIGQHKAFAFSAASLKVTGGTDVSRVLVNWSPSLTIRTAGSASAQWDPVSLHLVDRKGKLRRSEELLNVSMRTKGAGTMHWRGDGQVSIDSDEAELDVRMPSTLAKERGELKLAVKAGTVSQRSAIGSLAAHRLPALGARTRIGSPATSTTPAQVSGLAAKSSQAMKFDIAVPKLAAGERFELRLGGGGAQEQ
jgi:hypothetical protein